MKPRASGAGRQLVCTIVGCKAASTRWNSMTESMARYVGKMAAEVGFVVCTGGHSGVMEAAAKGAKDVDGLTIGILTTDDPADANDWIDVAIPSGMGIARNSLTALAGDIMVAVPGGLGTLQELTYALEYDRPVLSWGSWLNTDLARREHFTHIDHTDHVHHRADVRDWIFAQYERLTGNDG